MHRVSLFVFCAFIISTAWASQKELKILAFGDSLTAGLSATREFQSIHHPYAIKLIELLLSKVKVNITNGGVSGDMVIDAMHQQLVGGRQDNMQMRLNRFLTEAEKNGTIYDWVLLMAGINDINSNKEAETIMTGLMAMYERIHLHKARLLAMTLMPLSAWDKPFYAKNEQQRQSLNKFIRHHISTAQNLKDNKVKPVLVDMDKLIPYSNETKLFCIDGLHLSPEGYDTMGSEIFKAMSPFLQNK